MTRPSRVRSAALSSVLSVALAALWVAGSGGAAYAAPTVLYVAINSPACSDIAPGTAASPFCHISPAAALAIAGQTVEVGPGTYAEQVSVAHSGVAGGPIVFAPAEGAIVTITGQARGFSLSGRSHVVIRGFTITQTVKHGIFVSNGTDVTVQGNHVSDAGEPIAGQTAPGIYLNNVTDSLVAGNVSERNSDSGILLAGVGTAGVLVRGNVTYRNARGYQRAAPGIDVRSGPNTIVGNISHDNEDSGLQFYTGAHDNVVAGNLSYRNGDHGIDDLNAPHQTIVGNTVFRNVTAGINLEGNSPGGTVANNVSVDNGINSPRTASNIRVDGTSIAGTLIDFDLVHLTEGTIQFTWGTTSYTSLAAFRYAHPEQEQRGLQASPRFANPAVADFHLTSGSPAIDSANAAAPGAQATDLSGRGRVDDPATPDTGTGPRTDYDRGAYEYQPA